MARNVLPIMVVAMQYCEEAATELLPMMAQRGRAIVLRAVRIKIVILRPLLRVLITTGCVILAELGHEEATS